MAFFHLALVLLSVPASQGLLTGVQRHQDEEFLVLNTKAKLLASWDKFGSSTITAFENIFSHLTGAEQKRVAELETTTSNGMEIKRKTSIEVPNSKFSLQISNCTTPTESGTQSCRMNWGDAMTTKAAMTFPVAPTKDAWFEVHVRPKISGLIDMAMAPLKKSIQELPRIDAKCAVCDAPCRVQVGTVVQEIPMMYKCSQIQVGKEIVLGEIDWPMPEADKIDTFLKSFGMLPHMIMEAMPPAIKFQFPPTEKMDTFGKMFMTMSHGIGYEMKMDVGLHENGAPIFSEKLLVSPASPGGAIVKM